MTNVPNRPAQVALVLVGFACAALAGCSTTQRVKVRNPAHCVFLRPIVCARLEPAGGKLIDMRYVNPNAKWQQYNKIMIMPITFWGSGTDEKDKLSASDRQALADYFHATLVEHLGEKFTVVDQPGPGVMKLQIAITDADAATPVLRTVSMVVPQARALNTLKYLATGTYGFIGSAQAEAELTDSVTGQLLVAGMDRQVGGGSIQTAAQWQWGDAENAMDTWAELLTTRLSSWTSGTATP
jgi:hypothetical protein